LVNTKTNQPKFIDKYVCGYKVTTNWQNFAGNILCSALEVLRIIALYKSTFTFTFTFVWVKTLQKFFLPGVTTFLTHTVDSGRWTMASTYHRRRRHRMKPLVAESISSGRIADMCRQETTDDSRSRR